MVRNFSIFFLAPFFSLARLLYLRHGRILRLPLLLRHGVFGRETSLLHLLHGTERLEMRGRDLEWECRKRDRATEYTERDTIFFFHSGLFKIRVIWHFLQNFHVIYPADSWFFFFFGQSHCLLLSRLVQCCSHRFSSLEPQSFLFALASWLPFLSLGVAEA